MKGNAGGEVETSGHNPDLWTLVEQRAKDHGAALLAVDENGRTLTLPSACSRHSSVSSTVC